MLERFGVELIGASVEAIHTAEDRSRFKAAMEEIGLRAPRSGFAYTVDEAIESSPRSWATRSSCGRRSSSAAAAPASRTTPTSSGRSPRAGSPRARSREILVEQSVLGWKEYELEVMRDHADNVVVICSIENFDPMGVHTGDSITVAPAQTLTDVEYQRMRDAAFACIRRIGVDTGGLEHPVRARTRPTARWSSSR